MDNGSGKTIWPLVKFNNLLSNMITRILNYHYMVTAQSTGRYKRNYNKKKQKIVDSKFNIGRKFWYCYQKKCWFIVESTQYRQYLEFYKPPSIRRDLAP